MHNRSLAIVLSLAAFCLNLGRGIASHDAYGSMRVMGAHRAPGSTPNNSRHTGAAASKRAARKRRNIRARAAKH